MILDDIDRKIVVDDRVDLVHDEISNLYPIICSRFTLTSTRHLHPLLWLLSVHHTLYPDSRHSNQDDVELEYGSERRQGKYCDRYQELGRS